jgi:kynurenine formamidase
LENVDYLGDLPPIGAFVIALPMKIKRGTGWTLRIVACLPG